MTGLLDELQFFDCVMSDEKIAQLAKHCHVASCGNDGDGSKAVLAEGTLNLILGITDLPIIPKSNKRKIDRE